MSAKHHRHRQFITPRGNKTSGLHLIGGNNFNINKTLLKPLPLNGVTGKPSKKYNMMTPRRLEAITPRTVRSFRKQRPSTCLPRIQSSRGLHLINHHCPETNYSDSSSSRSSTPPSVVVASTTSEMSVLDRILCSGKTAALVPRKVEKNRMKAFSARNNGNNIGQRKRKPRVPIYKQPTATTNNRRSNKNVKKKKKEKKKKEEKEPSRPHRHHHQYHRHYDEEYADDHFHDPQEATAVNAGLMTEAQLLDMMCREITPEDFAMLLLLDETNDKKYKTVQQDIFDKFECVKVPDDDNYECRVCLEAVKEEVDGEKMAVKLPCCGRIFHKSCIKKWLREYSKTCPSCRICLDG